MIVLVKALKKLGVSGMALFPFILIVDRNLKNNKSFINHERIHLQQQLEMLVVFFYLWYVIEYLILRLKYNHNTAYRSIVFEKEAYLMDGDASYLSSRSTWAFLNFYTPRKQ